MKEPMDGVRKNADNEIIQVTIPSLNLRQATKLTTFNGVSLTGNAGQWYALKGTRKKVREAIAHAKVKGIIV